MAGFIETKDNLEKYTSVSYKHNNEGAGKSMENMEYPENTDPEKPTDPTYRVAYKKWERKFDNYD